VPSLRIPHELFAVSNRPIVPPKNPEQNRPALDHLDKGAMFVWCYWQTPDDPNPDERDAVPDYSRWSVPLDYDEAQVFPSSDARQWDSSMFTWRRIGFAAPPTWVTVMVWEGTRAAHGDIDTARAVLASVGLS